VVSAIRIGQGCVTIDSDREQSIQRSALGMVANHGPHALAQANVMVNKMALQRDAEGIAMWRDIARAIKKMQP
jgi:hypothetical protein